MSGVARSIVGVLVGLALIELVVFVTNVEPADLTWLLFVLTGAAWASFFVLGRAAVQPPRIDALTERTFIALIVALLGTVSCLITYNTDHGRILFDTNASSLLFRLAILGVLMVPAIWLILYAVGRLGRTGKG